MIFSSTTSEYIAASEPGFGVRCAEEVKAAAAVAAAACTKIMQQVCVNHAANLQPLCTLVANWPSFCRLPQLRVFALLAATAPVVGAVVFREAVLVRLVLRDPELRMRVASVWPAGPCVEAHAFQT